MFVRLYAEDYWVHDSSEAVSSMRKRPRSSSCHSDSDEESTGNSRRKTKKPKKVLNKVILYNTIRRIISCFNI